MPKEAIFKKTVLGGFNKKEVIDYIDTLNQASLEAQTSLKTQINHLTTMRDGLEKKVTTFEDRLSIIELQLEQKQQRINELAVSEDHAHSEINKLCRKLEDTQVALSEREAEIFSKAKQYRELEGKMEELKERSSRYEQITSSVGEVMLAAKTQAERTISEANKISQRIVVTAKNEGKTITKETFETVDDMKGELETFKEEIDMLRDALRQTVNTCEDRIGKISSAVDITINRLVNSRSNFDKKITQALDKLIQEPINLSEISKKDDQAVLYDESDRELPQANV